MPQRDVATELGSGFILLYLLAGPLLAGIGLGAATHLLRPSLTRVFDRIAIFGLPSVLLVSIALVYRSHGWSLLFVIPYGMVVFGIILFRRFTASRRSWRSRLAAHNGDETRRVCNDDRHARHRLGPLL